MLAYILFASSYLLVNLFNNAVINSWVCSIESVNDKE
jgi:hypothetical protein